jgi:hypothetical protein
MVKQTPHCGYYQKNVMSLEKSRFGYVSEQKGWGGWARPCNAWLPPLVPSLLDQTDLPFHHLKAN